MFPKTGWFNIELVGMGLAVCMRRSPLCLHLEGEVVQAPHAVRWLSIRDSADYLPRNQANTVPYML